ncbi:MAG: uroporphyrinogen-III synthase [Woeseiaceae bacterium]
MNSPSEEAALANKGILITRAVTQAEPFARAVTEAGGLPVLLPGISIEPVKPVHTGDEADWVIFISPNAVTWGLDEVSRLINNGAQVAAIGPSTARELATKGISQPLHARDGFDSESLLRLPVFRDLRGKRIVIVRGVGGRAKLHETLRQRGAEIVFAETYRRDRPTLSAEQVQYMEDRWASGVVSATTCLSVATLDNIMTTLTTRGQRMFNVTPLLSPSHRVLERAQQLGHNAHQKLASGPEVKDLVADLVEMANNGQI